MRVALFGFEMPTVAAIYRTYEKDRKDEERTYLGASIIGEECWRQLWYGFRWANEPEEFDGRKLRLFKTGHREEIRMIADLKRAGIQVWNRDPDNPSRQIGVVEIGGHFRGHMDGIGLGILEAPKTPHLLEFKTHNSKSFKKLKEKGVQESKPTHYAQMQVYMHLQRLTRALYLAHHKDTDELYAERIVYDPVFAERLMAKAHSIVTAQEPPAKMHEDPSSRAAFACGWCAAKKQCHERAWARRNCRTCLHATPELDGDGRWTCARHKIDLTPEDQKSGCANHLYIPALVPGDLVDSDPERGTVSYDIGGGEVFVDGGTENPREVA